MDRRTFIAGIPALLILAGSKFSLANIVFSKYNVPKENRAVYDGEIGLYTLEVPFQKNKMYIKTSCNKNNSEQILPEGYEFIPQGQIQVNSPLGKREVSYSISYPLKKVLEDKSFATSTKRGPDMSGRNAKNNAIEYFAEHMIEIDGKYFFIQELYPEKSDRKFWDRELGNTQRLEFMVIPAEPLKLEVNPEIPGSAIIGPIYVPLKKED